MTEILKFILRFYVLIFSVGQFLGQPAGFDCLDEKSTLTRAPQS